MERRKEGAQKQVSIAECPNNMSKNTSQINGKVAFQQYSWCILYKDYTRALQCIIHQN